MNLIKILIFIFVFNTLTFSKGVDRDNTLIIAQEKDPRTFDPHFGNDGFSLRVNRLIYSRLVEKDSNMKSIPGIAKKWRFIDNKNIEFEIFPNILFQNGDKMTTEDIKYSFERMKKSPRISAILPPIERVDIIDKNKFIMRLSKPFSPIIDQLSHPALSIVSKKYVESNKDALKSKPMGSGPYILNSWDPGNTIILKRFHSDLYSNKLYDEIKINTIPLATNRTIALETNEVDIAFSLPVQDKVIIDENKDLMWKGKPSYSYTYMGLNLKSQKLKDIRVREAIDLAINKKEILEVVLDNEGEVANSPVAKGVFGYNPNIETSKFNPELAKSYLKKGISLSLATMNNGIDVQTAQLIQGYLKEIGIDVKINILEPNIYWSETNKGNYDMFIGSWGSVTGDSDYALYPTHHSKAFGQAGNRTFFFNEEVDKLLDQGRNTLDKKEREKIYFKIQELIVKNKSEVMLFYREINCGINKKDKNFDLFPIPIHSYSLENLNKFYTK